MRVLRLTESAYENGVILGRQHKVEIRFVLESETNPENWAEVVRKRGDDKAGLEYAMPPVLYKQPPTMGVQLRNLGSSECS